MMKFIRRIVAAIEDVPYAIGINNHMGSKATADERVMKILVDICKERNLILLDSRRPEKPDRQDCGAKWSSLFGEPTFLR